MLISNELASRGARAHVLAHLVPSQQEVGIAPHSARQTQFHPCHRSCRPSVKGGHTASVELPAVVASDVTQLRPHLRNTVARLPGRAWLRQIHHWTLQRHWGPFARQVQEVFLARIASRAWRKSMTTFASRWSTSMQFKTRGASLRRPLLRCCRTSRISVRQCTPERATTGLTAVYSGTHFGTEGLQ